MTCLAPRGDLFLLGLVVALELLLADCCDDGGDPMETGEFAGYPIVENLPIFISLYTYITYTFDYLFISYVILIGSVVAIDPRSCEGNDP